MGSLDCIMLDPVIRAAVEGVPQVADSNKVFPDSLWQLRHKLIVLFQLHWVAHIADRPASYNSSQMWHAYQEVLRFLDNEAVTRDAFGLDNCRIHPQLPGLDFPSARSPSRRVGLPAARGCRPDSGRSPCAASRGCFIQEDVAVSPGLRWPRKGGGGDAKR